MSSENYGPFRGLEEGPNSFFEELKDKNSKLHYILEFESKPKNRKCFMVEIRKNFLDLYFLGHTVEVRGSNKTKYYLTASDKFNPFKPLVAAKANGGSDVNKWKKYFNDIKTYPEFENIMNIVMSKIVIHKKGNISEGISEINHFIDNRAIGKNGILVIDRQVVYPKFTKKHRIDLLGLKKLDNNKLSFVVIELKNKNNTEIGEVFEQVSEYIDVLYNEKRYNRFKVTYEKILQQKKDLRLLTRKGIPHEIVSWDEISQKGKGSIEGIVILDNYNIKSDLSNTKEGLLHRAIRNWEDVDKKGYNIKLFLKTNILDDTFFKDMDETKAFLKAYKR